MWRCALLQIGCGLRLHARDEHGLLPAALQGIDDASDLLRRFARAVDDLGRALPQTAVMVDARIAEVLKRSLAQLQEPRPRRRCFPSRAPA